MATRVRLITKGGYDWTKRYPWIVRGRAEEPAKPVCGRRRGRDPGRRRPLRFQRAALGQAERRSSALRFRRAGDRRRGSSVPCPDRCGRRTLSGCCAGGQMVFSSTPSRAARSARTCSAPRATWVWKAWCQSAVIGPTAAAGRRTGSRSRTAAITHSIVSGKRWHERREPPYRRFPSPNLTIEIREQARS